MSNPQVNKILLMAKAGHDMAELLLLQEIQPPASCAAYTKQFETWQPDNKIQKAYTMCVFENILYMCESDIAREKTSTPNVMIDNYIPYPTPDENNVYPYIANMQVDKGMLIKNNMNRIYKALENISKLVDDPANNPLKFAFVTDNNI